ncbi:MAG: carbohydrate binding domain-containing protein [Planctomycetota bacterium]
MKRRENGLRRSFRGLFFGALILVLALAFWAPHGIRAQSLDPRPPKRPVKLVFIHHSCGENWLSDADGGLGRELARNNYFVSDTNYGWGPNGIGDRTDITDWPEWFTGPESRRCLTALFREREQHSDYARTAADPGGENQVVLFKSCFPNSNLEGNPTDPPARGDGLTVANAKAIYNDLLRHFATRPDKLFVVITAPPVQDRTHAANARAFNTWLVRDWLAGYRGKNVAVFDFYNVLTGQENHHRFREGRIEHVNASHRNTLHYPSDGDDHPSRIGNRRATEEFVPLLNVYTNRWIATRPETGPSSAPQPEPPPRVMTVEPPPVVERPSTTPNPRRIDDFEGELDAWAAFRDEGKETSLTFAQDKAIKHDKEASLQVRYDLAPESWATCSLVHDQPRDWSHFQGLSLYVHAEKAGQAFTLVAYGGKSSDDLLHFERRFQAGESAVGGWQQLEVRWEQLKPAPWQGDAGQKFDPRSAMGVALAFESSDGARNAGRLWIDDVTLLPAGR